MALSIPLPVDSLGRRFVGWGSGSDAWLPSGTRIGSTNFAVPHALLVDASGNALVVGVDLDSGGGTANRAGFALLVPASGGPAVVPGDTANGLDVDVTRLPAPLGTGIMVAATSTDAGSGTDDEAVVAAAAGVRLIGWSAKETTGSAGAVFNIRHGDDAADAILVPVTLAANESAREWYGPAGMAAASGIYLERVSGNVQVVVHHATVA